MAKTESNSARCCTCNRFMPRKTSKRKHCSIHCRNADKSARSRAKFRARAARSI